MSHSVQLDTRDATTVSLSPISDCGAGRAVLDFLDLLAVTILGSGDLVPRRRNGRAGRSLAVLAGVVVLALLIVGAVKLLTGGSSPKKVSTLPLCPVTAPVGPAKPKAVHLTVLNGTLTGGLAGEVGNDLTARGFHVTSVGNTQQMLPTGTTAVVSYGPGRLLAAQAVAAEIAGAKIVKGTVPGVQLGVGPAFTALASKSDVVTARRAFVVTDTPAAPTPTPSATPTCRPA
jgi:hypothetical protein